MTLSQNDHSLAVGKKYILKTEQLESELQKQQIQADQKIEILQKSLANTDQNLNKLVK